ncbi:MULTISPECIES: EAL domain-containing protein [Idiomarina]|uniref:EAL domain-containing protein n=1 Tax=Idiomarina TaxID=135575 RepID=UPI00129C42E9|nr:EAL domain-containing protein [Idiomarina sp. FeN1]
MLSKLGIKCAVDDFGTGNSSISYLSKFPVAELKLDRSYVFDINNNDRNLKIVKSSIDLAHALGLKVTAEGVEDFAAITLLKQLGCEKAQGYVIARPLAEHDFIALVNSPFQWSASS